MVKRLRELDFLRGIAILIVLIGHSQLSIYTFNMVWSGVDLFFVLSGFLVSGLLFKEYLKFGNIRPKLFLIRRGFKIYPIYYLSIIPYLLLSLRHSKFDITGFIVSVTFTQNLGFTTNYLNAPSWSLAVEEQFYFGLTFFLFLLFKFKPALIQSTKFVKIVISLIIFCLLLRITGLASIHSIKYLSHFLKLFERIDSLLWGVLISYFFYFKNESLRVFYFTNRTILLIVMTLGLVWTPFVPYHSLFIYRYGFTLTDISFGILLTMFLLEERINVHLNTLFSTSVVNSISKIGFCSYSIYVAHTLLLGLPKLLYEKLHIIVPYYIDSLSQVLLSVLVGMLLTYFVENYFLLLRNKYYPSRV
jgi:peptidoglycan/LPS O-acetylase OafA/YrhL